MKPTINKPEWRTFDRNGSGLLDWTRAHPWRAPGSAPVFDSCGIAGGSTKNNEAAGGFVPSGHRRGDKGSELAPVASPSHWMVGSVVEVAWGILANHGGGYQYRLCPKGQTLTEECFMRTPLPFVGSTQLLRFANGTESEIPATLVSEGTLPEGSTWAMNPVPACLSVSGGFQEQGCDKPQFPPPPGCDKTCWGYVSNPMVNRTLPAVIDRLRVPADLQPGSYVLGFRWDCEQTPQIWTSCADIIVSPAPVAMGIRAFI